MKRLFTWTVVLAVAFVAPALAATPPAASQPASQPDSAARVRLLKAHAEDLVFEFSYLGQTDKPFYTVTLSAPDFMITEEPDSFRLKERITAEQAGKIVDLLAGGGWLDKAQQVGANWRQDPADAGYWLRIGFGKVAFAGPLGFDLKMLRLLDAIRAVLDGDAAKAMVKLIGRMSGLRRQWEAAAE